MLFEPPALDREDADVLAALHSRRDRLAQHLRTPRRWEGNLRRNLMAKAIQGSNSIEGYVVETDDAAAAYDGQEPLTADARTFAEIRGYRQALGYVLTLAEAQARPDVSTVLALHFMMLGHDLAKSPGQLRASDIYVKHQQTGRTVYQGPDADGVAGLLAEFVSSLDAGLDPLVDGAMAHLNFVMIHPFRDGNGRMARALQTLVLGRGGIAEPAFSSVEEWLGANTADYYRALEHAGAGAWNPHRDTTLWVKFILRAHHMQSQTLERRVRRSELVWQRLETMLIEKGLPDRAFDALFDAVLGYRIRRSGYVAQADVAEQTATRDLKALSDGSLLRAHGEKRGRFYTAGSELTALRDEVTASIAVQVTEPYVDFRMRLAADVR